MDVSDGLGTLVHFYNDQQNLFVTVTMYPAPDRSRVLDQIVDNKAWFWGRFAQSERAAYMLQRLAVEQIMYQEFEQRYWKLPTRSPVYFYIYPRLDEVGLRTDTERSPERDEHNTKVLEVKLEELTNTESISFTMEDSFQSFRQILQSRKLTPKKGRQNEICSECQGRIFHIDELRDVYAKHTGDGRIYFEVQVWDPTLLDSVKARFRAST